MASTGQIINILQSLEKGVGQTERREIASKKKERKQQRTLQRSLASKFETGAAAGKKIGKKQARFLDNLGLSAGLISPVTGRAKKGSRNIGGIVDDIILYRLL